MNKAYWNKIASLYETDIFNVFKQDKNKQLPSYFRKYANKSHLAIDFGCGIGRSFSHLSPRFGKILAVDYAQKLLDIAKLNARTNIEIKQMDLTKSRLQLPVADFAFCANVVISGDTEKNHAIIKNIQKSLRPGGAAVFVVPSLESVIYRSRMAAVWFKKAGTRFKKIPKSQWSEFRLGKKSFLLGLIDLNGVITKHYSQEELLFLFNSTKLKVKGIKKLEYDWSGEFESPPKWMKDPYPWDWIVECEREK